jgi:hypothetical protein
MSNSFDEFATNAFETPFPGASNTETPVAAANPFASEGAAEAAPATPATEGSPTAPTAEGATEGKKRGRKPKAEGEEGEKKTRSPHLTTEQKKFIIENYSKTGIDEIAKELDVNVHQVRNTISQFKKDMTKRIEESESEEDKAKFQKFIDVFLSKPDAPKEKKGRKSDNTSIIDDLLKDLMN